MNSVPSPLLCCTVSILMKLQEPLNFSKELQRSDMRQQRNEAEAVKRVHRSERVSVDYLRKAKQPWGSVYLAHQHGASPALSWSWLLACYLATLVEHGFHHLIQYNQWRLCSPSYLKCDLKSNKCWDQELTILGNYYVNIYPFLSSCNIGCWGKIGILP